MNSRIVVTILLAGILILLVMGVAVIMTFAGSINTSKFSVEPAWSQAFSAAESMKIIDLSGDGQPDLFLQSQGSVRILDANGNTQFEQSFSSPLASTLGDIDGDGVEDALVYSMTNGPQITVISKGQIAWEQAISSGFPARTAVIRFASGTQIILGDNSGQLIGLSTNGQEIWRTNLSRGDTIRGLDDARIAGQVFLAAANHDGTVSVFDSNGQPRWPHLLSGGLRRLRAYDLNGDGTSEILLGGEYGDLRVLNADNGAILASQSLGQAITEIREVEVNGDPTSREFVAGGKEGGVWAFDINGNELWSASLSDKVTEISGIDMDEDGAEETIIGDDSGAVNLFTGKSGERHKLTSRDSGITRIDVGKLAASRQLAVADGQGVQVFSLAKSSLPPLRFTPLLVGLIISAIILAAAWFIATLPAKPAIKAAIEDQSPESLQAGRRMLKESIADVERLRHGGEMTADAYLARLKKLREQLAENETALKKAGIHIAPETFKCPNCGGTLPLGLDKCDYCGQVVIS